MNKVAEEYAKRLNNIALQIKCPNDNNLFSDGYEMAVFCIKEGLSDRVDFITEVYSDESDEISTIVACKEQIDSLLRVLNSCLEDIEHKSIQEGYQTALNDFVFLLNPVMEWLKNFK